VTVGAVAAAGYRCKVAADDDAFAVIVVAAT